MAYRALKTFTGKVSMVKGEVRELEENEDVKDLVKAGYISDLSEKAKAKKSSKPTKEQDGGEE